MDSRIRGSWPGGPKRDGPAQVRSGPPRLQRVEHIEAHIAHRTVRAKRGARAKRLAWGLALSSVVALAFGWALGLRSHATLEEVTAAQPGQTLGVDFNEEINKTLLELWKMDEVQYQRNRR